MDTLAIQSDPLQNNAYFEHITIPTDQSFLWRMDDYPWRRCVWNYHPEFEIHLIRHSSGLAYVGDHIGSFEAGQLVLVGSNLPHNWVTPSIGDAKLLARDIVVQFDPACIHALAPTMPEFAEIAPLFERATLGIEFLGETATEGAALLEAMAHTTGLVRFARLAELLALMARSAQYRTLATPQFLSQFRLGSPAELELLDRALAYMQRNFLNAPSLGDVADIVGMSDSSFSRFFKAHTGNTFSDHITTLRIWTARKLLSETDRSVTDVCFESGFSNISNFNRTFLFRLDLTPSQYRKAARSRNVP